MIPHVMRFHRHARGTGGRISYEKPAERELDRCSCRGYWSRLLERYYRISAKAISGVQIFDLFVDLTLEGTSDGTFPGRHLPTLQRSSANRTGA
jgi:hypothetical protein